MERFLSINEDLAIDQTSSPEGFSVDMRFHVHASVPRCRELLEGATLGFADHTFSPRHVALSG
jgi:hypothetical protein